MKARCRVSIAWVVLCVALFAGTSPAAPVRFDFNAPGGPTQTGWNAADRGTGSAGTISIETEAIGAVTLDTRDRNAANTDGGGDVANNDLWRDFVFANGSFSSAPDTGLQITISGLEPNKTYPITIWAFDDSSNASAGSSGRAADWSGSGAPPTLLTFPSDPDPGSLLDYAITLDAAADGDGIIVLMGIVSATNPDTSHNVFVNGLEIGDPVGDADGDGMPDGFEQDIIDADDNDAIEDIEDVLPGDDFDADGSSNLQEFNRGTNPVDPDSDDDGLADGVEDGGGTWESVAMTGTDPLSADSDNDGLGDGVENPDLPYDAQNPEGQPGTDPNNPDSDGDGASDGREVFVDGSDPTDPSNSFDPLADATVLFDFNAPGSPTQPGWVGAELGNGTDGTITVATEAIDAVTVDTRDRNAANTDGGDIDNNDMWRDFVFANGSFDLLPGSGLRITLSGLLPSTTYPIRIWAFDESSNNGRDADWGVSGEPPQATLAFPSAPDPASIRDYFITLEVITDASGTVVIDGVVAAVEPDASHNVFVNGLMVGPPGGTAVLEITGFAFDPVARQATITWRSLPGRTYALDSSDNLDEWFELDDGISSEGESTSFVDTTIPESSRNRFYRVREAE